MPLAEPPTQPLRGHQTICLPCSREQDEQCVEDPQEFRRFLDQPIEAHPELFPPEIPQGYRMKDLDTSRKTGWRLRRIDFRDDQSSRVRPSFVRPSLTGNTEDVQAPRCSASASRPTGR